MRPGLWKVGELARRTGISVRTLHHYDEIGVLRPSHHTGSGHRLYAAGELNRLLRIVSLRQLGFSLEEIRDCLDRPDFSPQRVIELHIARLKEEVALAQQLCERLEAIAARLNSAGEVPADEFLGMIEEMTMMEKHYTPEQREAIRERGRQLGEERIHRAEAEWKELIAEVRTAMQSGADPASEAVRSLARRWRGLVNEFTGGDPGIEQSLNAMYRQEPEVQRQAGIDSGMFEYIGAALAADK